MHYFGRLVRDEPIVFETMELPFYARAGDLARAVGVDVATLKEANPALRSSVWKHAKYVPKGYELRVPRAALARPLSRGIAAVPQDRRHVRQTRDTHYTVRRGDTLSTIARRHRVRMSELVALNGLKSRHRIRVGQKLRLPSDAARSTTTVAHRPETSTPDALPSDGVYTVRRGDNLTRIAERFGLSVADLMAMNELRSRNRISVGQKLRVSTNAAAKKPEQTVAKAAPTPQANAGAKAAPTPQANAGAKAAPTPQASAEANAAPRPQASAEANAAPTPKASAEAKTSTRHPDAVAALSPARIADPEPGARDLAEAAARAEEEGLELSEGDSRATKGDESAVDPSPGLLADPSDYTVGSDGSIIVQPNETLGHFAEWLGLRASRLRRINGLDYDQSLGVQQRLRLDFSQVRPEEFERIRIDYHRALQEEFFSEWEIEGTRVHRVGPGDSLWVLSTRRLKVPIWLLRQYNPDVDLEALSMGTKLTVPLLRQRGEESSRSDETLERTAATS
jgi:membrane-bound lytic murein transglycosylase D